MDDPIRGKLQGLATKVKRIVTSSSSSSDQLPAQTRALGGPQRVPTTPHQPGPYGAPPPPHNDPYFAERERHRANIEARIRQEYIDKMEAKLAEKKEALRRPVSRRMSKKTVMNVNKVKDDRKAVKTKEEKHKQLVNNFVMGVDYDISVDALSDIQTAMITVADLEERPETSAAEKNKSTDYQPAKPKAKPGKGAKVAPKTAPAAGSSSSSSTTDEAPKEAPKEEVVDPAIKEAMEREAKERDERIRAEVERRLEQRRKEDAEAKMREMFQELMQTAKSKDVKSEQDLLDVEMKKVMRKKGSSSSSGEEEQRIRLEDDDVDDAIRVD